MTSPVDIRPDQLEIVQDILLKHLPTGVTVWVFGSRANWTTKDSSDLDLALEGEGKLSHKVLGALKDAFEGSTLPYTVDIVDFNRIGDPFKQIVESQRALLQLDGGGTKHATSSGWCEATLGECAELIRDSVSPSDMGDAPYIGLEHIGEGTLSLLGQGVATDVTSTKTRFQHGDILFGKLRPYFRKVVRAPVNGLCSTDIWVVRSKDGVRQDYLYYCMASQQFIDFATAGSEGTRMPRAIWEYVSRYELSLPSPEEQRAIAHVLGTLDDKIELNRRMNETLEAVARALFKSWFVDFDPVRAKIEGHWRRDESLPGLPAELYELFPDRLVDSELGEIPAGWEVKTLGDLVQLNPREPLKRGTLAPYLDMAALPTSGSSPDSPVVRDYKSGTRFRNGDALLARITPCLENGKTAFVQSLATGAVGWGSTEFIVMRAVPPVPSEYTYLLARDDGFREHAIQNMTGTSGRQRVQIDALAPYPLTSPPAEFWNNFSTLVSPLFAQMEINRRESLALAAQRDALLPGLVSGEVGI